jgi:uncharacterized membrane protein
MADVQVRTPRWLSPVSFGLALLGLGLATYLTIEHFRGAHHLAGCTVGGIVDCGAVTTSPESHLLGIPVALLGLIYFVAAIPFLTPAAWRSRNRVIRLGRLAGAIIGLGMVLWLVYAELGKIHKICEYCTAVHVVTFSLFVVIAYGTISTSAMPLDDAAGESAA